MAKNVVKSVQLKWNKTAERQINQARIEATFNLGYDIAAKARWRAPVWSGALRNSIRVEPIPSEKGVQVIAGGMVSRGVNPKTRRPIERFIDYAAKRERGPNKPKVPPSEHYMENAMKDILKGDWIKKYYGHITQKGAK